EELARREHEDHERWWGWTKNVHLSGYLQPQMLWQWVDTANASPNLVNGALPPGVGPNDVIARQDSVFNTASGTGVPGLTSNGDFFRLRRARMKIELEANEWSRFVFEIDPVATGGPDNGTGTIARNVEAQGVAHWSEDVTTTFGMGIFKIPFGWEVLQSDADRPFIERSWWEQNITPGEFDTGAKAYTTALHDRLTGQVALINGQTQGEKTFAILPDLNNGKDVVGRVNYDFGPFDVGASGYYGQGQLVSLSSLAFKQFPRYAWNIELGVHHRFLRIGETRLLAEFDRGQNMDRGTKYNPAISMPGLPTDVANGTVVSKDEIGYWARIEQDITHWVTLAVRYDVYSPDTAQGTTINGRQTEGAVASVHFTRALQLNNEYDHFTDNVHAPGDPIPYRQGNMLSTVFQVRFP
ncbi:MAG: porin, partial [Polyangiaceae bacterium]